MSYTSAQIIGLSTQIAKAPGYTQQAGQFLNMILADLARTYDFEYIRKKTTLVIQPTAPLTPFPLPADYLRAQKEGVFYNISGAITVLNQIPLSDFDRLFSGPGLNDYPQSFATDTTSTPTNMFFWPNPSTSLSVTVRYFPLPADITNPESSMQIPWFADQRYLIKKLCADLMTLTDDERQPKFETDAADLLKKIMPMDDDSEGFTKRVELDQRFFRGQESVKPTKVQPL